MRQALLLVLLEAQTLELQLVFQRELHLINALLDFISLSRSLEKAPRISLQARATAKSLLYEAAASYRFLSSDPNLATAYIQECGILVQRCCIINPFSV